MYMSNLYAMQKMIPSRLQVDVFEANVILEEINDGVDLT